MQLRGVCDRKATVGLEQIIAPVKDIKKAEEKRKYSTAVLVDLPRFNFVALLEGADELGRHGRVIVHRPANLLQGERKLRERSFKNEGKTSKTKKETMAEKCR